MDCSLHVSGELKLADHDFGPDHPMAPMRVKLTMELAGALGVLAADGATVAAASPGDRRLASARAMQLGAIRR